MNKLDKLDKSQLLKVAKQLDLKGLSRKNKLDIKAAIVEALKNRPNETGKINIAPVVNRDSIVPGQKSHLSMKAQKPLHSSGTSEDSCFNIKNCCYPKVKRLIAIGDIHGDLVAAIKSLKLAGVVDNKIPNTTKDINAINWIGGDTNIIQLGDQIDRVRPSNLFNNMCPQNDPDIHEDEGSDLKIICLFNKLHAQALKQGGACLSILGNHELMNVEGDFRYVSPKEFREFGNFFKANKSLKNSNFPYGYKERKESFKPGGIIAKKLADTRYSVVQVGSWIFVHGGITSEMASKYSLNDINGCVRSWLQGSKCNINDSKISDIYHNDDDSQSPFWSRIYSDLEEFNDPNNNYKNEFHKTIGILNSKNNRNSQNAIKGMILGHSPQFMYNAGINSDCDNRLWRVDIGMSRAFGPIDDDNHRKVQVLLIEDDDKFFILKEK
jgi:hypothetical protein